MVSKILKVQNLNVSRKKRAFKKKERTFFLITKSLLRLQKQNRKNILKLKQLTKNLVRNISRCFLSSICFIQLLKYK